MQRFENPELAREDCARVRGLGLSIGLVPTMGALHAGHLALVRRAVSECEHTVVSVFVNPLQFDEPSDFERYPREFDGDAALLEEAGASAVFTGTPDEFFPEGADGGSLGMLDPGPRALGLEGEYRPGHFAGVATVVARLFEITRPDRAYFGAKDYQQSLVVEDLARSMGYPEVVVCPTVREPSGLALSSRNALLSAEARERGLALSRALEAGRRAWAGGERGASRLREALLSELGDPELELDYAEIRDPARWSAGRLAGSLEAAHALIAARVGGVRLIDNARLDTRVGSSAAS